MKLTRRVALFFTDRFVLSFFAVIILVHVAMMFSYLQESNSDRFAVRRNAVIQKIINAIYTVEATPLANRTKAVSAMEDPDIKVTLTSKPSGKLKFQTISYFKIFRALRHNLTSFSLSIEMGPEQWLNVTATLYHHILYRQLFLLAAEILIFGSVFISAWSIRRFTKPLKRFKQAAEQMGIDLHSKPLDLYGPPVVREAAQAINQMRDRIQDLIRDRTQMLAAISHDLRTPITRMKLRSQFLEDPDLMHKFVMDLDEMSHMIDEVLAFAREDAKGESKKRLDLISFLDAICTDYLSMGLNIEFVSALHRVPIMARPIALKRAFNNVVNNARRYAQHVSMAVGVENRYIVICLQDDGPGIPEDQMAHVFEPFYRLDKSRNRATGGVGLGLAVTQEIIHAHDGQLNLCNLQPSGLQVTVKLPMLKA